MAHFGSGIWSKTRRTTGPIFKVTVPAIMIRSLCRGLGRKTPAPKRSMSKRPAPVAIISIAQHARPKVIGHKADLRAQLTTGALMSSVFAPTVRRTEFISVSKRVKTNPSSCSAIALRHEGGGMRDDFPTLRSHSWFYPFGHSYKHGNQFVRFVLQWLKSFRFNNLGFGKQREPVKC